MLGEQAGRGVLLGVQVAVSVIVLVGSGLLVRRVQQQASFDPGIPVDDLSVVTFASAEGPVEGARRYAFVTELSASLRTSRIGPFGFTTSNPFGPKRGMPLEVRLQGDERAPAK